MNNELTRILSFWIGMQDTLNGGYYGRMKGDGTLMLMANKGAILNARILWTFSAAYRLNHRQEYLAAAIHAKNYILGYFLDSEYGGTYWEVDYEGNPTDLHKQFYAQAFMLYGLTEFVRATEGIDGMEESRQEALDEALSLYHIIERYGRDTTYGGYIEACTREWGTMEDMRLSDLDDNMPKSQNTHLHILEAYTNLYRVTSHPDVAQSLHQLITLFCDKILNPETIHLDLFFEMDWTRNGARRESYGHDIECSWLLHEAAMVLGDREVLARVEPIVQTVAAVAEKGINPDGSMTHEANLDTGYREPDRHWWVQAETVVGYYNIYQHFGSEHALELSRRNWQYIQDNLIDSETGEWFWSCDEQGNPDRKNDLAGFWKCPYHNARMCMEIMTRQKGK